MQKLVPSNLSSYRVAYIEDELEDFLYVSQRLKSLKGTSIKLTNFKTVSEFEKKGKDQFDAVLLDLHLPDTSDMKETIRRVEKVSESPIIVLSGAGTLEEQGFYESYQNVYAVLSKNNFSEKELASLMGVINKGQLEKVLLQKETAKQVIAQNIDTLKKFNGNISHHINNALAVIHGAFMQCRDKVDEKNAKRIEKAIQRISTISTQSISLSSIQMDDDSELTNGTDFKALLDERSVLCLDDHIDWSKLDIEVQISGLESNLGLCTTFFQLLENTDVYCSVDWNDACLKLDFFILDQKESQGIGFELDESFLSYCGMKQVADYYGFEVGVVEREGVQSIHWALPAQLQTEKKQSAKRVVKNNLQFQSEKENVKLIFLEDNDVLRDYTETIFRRKGIELVSVRNGLEGLNQFLIDPDSFDMIITDIVMPEMNGIEFVKEVKNKGYTLPVIFLTGTSGELIAESEVLKEVPYKVLSKPCHSKTLLSAIINFFPKLIVKQAN